MIDDIVLATLRYPALLPNLDKYHDFWIPVIEKAILCLSDQMLLTGLAMLIVAYALHCSISVYHVTIVCDLAWLSANAHLTTLTVLRDYLRRRYPTQRNWRVFLMHCMMGFLVIATVWQGHRAWYESEPFNAQCLLQDLVGSPHYNANGTFLGVAIEVDGIFYKVGGIGGLHGYWMVLSLVLMAYAYVLTVLSLFSPTARFASKWFYDKPVGVLGRADEILKEKASPERITHKTTHQNGLFTTWENFKQLSYTCLRLITYMVCFLYIGIVMFLFSYSVQFCVDIYWFARGLFSLIIDRQIPEGSQMNGDENSMGFGQIVPILLLSSIVFVVKEAYDGEYPINHIAWHASLIMRKDQFKKTE